MGSIPGSGRSPGGEHGNQFQCSCLGNPLDRGAWRATVHGVTKSQTRLKRLCTHMHTYIVLSVWKQFKWHQAVCPSISVHFNCVTAASSFRAIETSEDRQLNHLHFADRGSNAQGASVTCFIQNHIDSWWVSAQCLFYHTALLASQNFRA